MFNRIIPKFLIILGVILPGLVLGAVSERDVYHEEKSAILVTANHPQFTIKLKSNPTTGFAWFLREYDSNFIQPLKHTFEAPVTKMLGASGTEVWTFRVKPSAFSVPQQTAIKFVYARPWEPNGQATQLIFRISTN